MYLIFWIVYMYICCDTSEVVELGLICSRNRSQLFFWCKLKFMYFEKSLSFSHDVLFFALVITVARYRVYNAFRLVIKPKRLIKCRVKFHMYCMIDQFSILQIFLVRHKFFLKFVSSSSSLSGKQCVDVASAGFSNEDQRPIQIPATKLQTPSGASPE